MLFDRSFTCDGPLRLLCLESGLEEALEDVRGV